MKSTVSRTKHNKQTYFILEMSGIYVVRNSVHVKTNTCTENISIDDLLDALSGNINNHSGRNLLSICLLKHKDELL